MIELNNNEHGHMLAAQAQCQFHNDVCFSRSENGKLLGGVIYQDYTVRTVGMHMASFDPRWLNRDLLWLMWDYPFVKLGVDKVFGKIRASNLKMLALAQHLGSIEEVRIKDVFPDGDLVLVAMYREHCRWLDMKPRKLNEGKGNG
jgi:RimJ/RimL family protein N-acetyltransferase